QSACTPSHGVGAARREKIRVVGGLNAAGRDSRVWHGRCTTAITDRWSPRTCRAPDDEGGQMRSRELVSTAHVVLCAVVVLSGCKTASPTADRLSQLIAKGRDLFFNETFAGNGRTCGTCHPAENNFTIDPAFIATLPKDNPLFVAEFNPDLK